MKKHLTPHDVPRDAELRRAWIKIELRRRGLPMADLAEREGVSLTAIQKTMTQASARFEKVLAEALGLEPKDLFPERYTEQGKRILISRPKRCRPVDGKAAAHG